MITKREIKELSTELVSLNQLIDNMITKPDRESKKHKAQLQEYASSLAGPIKEIEKFIGYESAEPSIGDIVSLHKFFLQVGMACFSFKKSVFVSDDDHNLEKIRLIYPQPIYEAYDKISDLVWSGLVKMDNAMKDSLKNNKLSPSVKLSESVIYKIEEYRDRGKSS